MGVLQRDTSNDRTIPTATVAIESHPTPSFPPQPTLPPIPHLLHTFLLSAPFHHWIPLSNPLFLCFSQFHVLFLSISINYIVVFYCIYSNIQPLSPSTRPPYSSLVRAMAFKTPVSVLFFLSTFAVTSLHITIQRAYLSRQLPPPHTQLSQMQDLVVSSRSPPYRRSK